jgi:hypothetical protein
VKEGLFPILYSSKMILYTVEKRILLGQGQSVMEVIGVFLSAT